MASSSSSSLFPSAFDNERPEIKSIRAILISVNEYIVKVVADTQFWDSLKSKFFSLLDVEKQEFFEFSEHSILSNLYWGIESIEAAIQAKWEEEKIAQLKNAETLLQVPALLDEHGATAGIGNRYFVCCSYFCLSLVRKLQNDEWQVAQDFLQAMLVSPRLVRTEFAVELCETLFSSSTISAMDFNEDSIDEAIRQIAGKYKHWLMYYRIMFYGETPQRSSRSNKISSENGSQYYMYKEPSSRNSSNSIEEGRYWQTFHNYEKVHPLDSQEYVDDDIADEPTANKGIQEFEYYYKSHKYNEEVRKLNIQNDEVKKYTSIKCLQEVLMEDQSDTSTSVSSCCSYYVEEADKEESGEDIKSLISTERKTEDDQLLELLYQKQQTPLFSMDSMLTTLILPHTPPYLMHDRSCEMSITNLLPERFLSSVNNLESPVSEHGDEKMDILGSCHMEDKSAPRGLQVHQAKVADQVACSPLQNCRFASLDQHIEDTGREKCITLHERNLNQPFLHSKKDSMTELMDNFGSTISKLCFPEGLAICGEDYAVEVSTIYEMLNNKRGEKYTMLKDVILDQLLRAISTSKEERIIRASVSILTTIISTNKSAVEDIKKKGLQLCDLATALKQNVHEAALLIYLINPSPTEIKTLELLPALVEVVCTSNDHIGKPESLILTPPAASLMIIEVLITAFDCATNNMHLAAINSPRVLSGLANIAGKNNQEEFVSLANILVKCMQFDGQCRKNISQFVPIAPFKCLLQSSENRAKFAALEFFHEILQMPRSSVISLLQRVQKEGSIDFIKRLMHCVQRLQNGYQLLAANLLLQLDALENSSDKSVREEAMAVILKSLASEESSDTQELASFILANIGGTYSWTGEPYTVAWLVKKAGLTSLHNRNMIRNFEWLDGNLQDSGIDLWCSKIAKSIIDVGKPVFRALEKGLRSKSKRVSRECLTAIAWIGCEIAKCPNNIRYSACKILLSGMEQFLHPGLDLEDRLLACLCIYNYASGRGMQKLIHFSEGVRESLRRFSSVTWMAEELHRVADYYLPNKSRISCVHTQVLEANHNNSGAVTALIYYKGFLFSGHLDGSIKVWDMKQQSATIVWDMKEHRKAVTCFSLSAGDSLLSGSSDKTIRVWQMAQKKLDCIEVIDMGEPIRQLETHGQMIFVITQGHAMKVFDSARIVKDICKRKKVNCMSVFQGKVYIGCLDSSIQELAITSNKVRKIKPPTKSWRIQSKPINSIIVFKDWLYSAGSTVEGSKVKEWRTTHCKPQMSIVTEKGRNVLAMGVVEDFMYLHCSSSSTTLQIWLRGTQQKVGRISAGSRITSLLTANDIVLCGTEKGLIKGWIPL